MKCLKKSYIQLGQTRSNLKYEGVENNVNAVIDLLTIIMCDIWGPAASEL